MPFTKKRQTPLIVLSVFLVIVMLVYTARVYSIQIINRGEYSNVLGSASTITATIKAPRGEILDCHGRKIAINRDGYNVVFNRAYIKDNLNDVILALINEFTAQSALWVDKLPLNETAPYDFKEGESTKKLISKLNLAHFATAKNCFDAMVEKYDLEKYSDDVKRKIMGVRYSMDISDFSISYPYTFAEDIPTELMRKISESKFNLDGVTVDIVPFRHYTDTSLAVNLIGSVGPIYEDDWQEYKNLGYSFNDKVGKSGIEKWGEKYLKGEDGEITYYLDSSGTIIESRITKAPVAGKTIMLTIDSRLQRLAQDAIEESVKIQRAEGGTAQAGSAVIIDVNTGKIRCAANYPTYDSATMGKDFDSLVSNPLKPLMNRAFQGVYPIGSTIKPAVAVAAMENGHYNIGESIKCNHQYTYFGDYKPSCMHRHGSILLKTALSRSCNYFFFELGRRIGALSITEYFRHFGLGTYTGVEVDDSKGILVEPKSNGFGGDTLQISIGQLNAFTPLQMANYVATFANGGTRYKATLIDKIVSYDISKTYSSTMPQIIDTVEIANETADAIKEGMLSVTVDGTGQATLGDYPIKVGGKTGTSQVEGKPDHNTFILFAPYEKPEIALSLVLEHSASSYASGSLVRKLLDAYFMADSGYSDDIVPGTLLK